VIDRAKVCETQRSAHLVAVLKGQLEINVQQSLQSLTLVRDAPNYRHCGEAAKPTPMTLSGSRSGV
jgi:hypothetical protein